MPSHCRKILWTVSRCSQSLGRGFVEHVCSLVRQVVKNLGYDSPSTVLYQVCSASPATVACLWLCCAQAQGRLMLCHGLST